MSVKYKDVWEYKERRILQFELKRIRISGKKMLGDIHRLREKSKGATVNRHLNVKQSINCMDYPKKVRDMCRDYYENVEKPLEVILKKLIEVDRMINNHQKIIFKNEFNFEIDDLEKEYFNNYPKF